MRPYSDRLGAAGLIRTSLTWDKFTTDRILTRAFEADLDELSFSFIERTLAGRILARACGSEAQAVALVDSWITELIRTEPGPPLHLDLGSLAGFRLLCSFGLGLGLGLAL
jgi:hypothetical protein